jgi:hypothetical protein
LWLNAVHGFADCFPNREKNHAHIPKAQSSYGRAVMAGLLQDLRFALRQLRKNPGFTITVTLMLAVAICTNSTVLSWINGTMLHPIPGARNTGALVSVSVPTQIE